MATVYRPVFSDRAVEYFGTLGRSRRRKLIDRARELAVDPTLTPDYRTLDAEGRDIGHLMVGGFIFTYWIDHPAKLVMIVDIDEGE